MSKSILYASRALESPPHEGGFVLLKDIAQSMAQDEKYNVHFFAKTKGEIENIHCLKVFSKEGWSFWHKIQYFVGLMRYSRKYDIVHTAHIPTKLNSILHRFIRKISKRSGTKFVQTVTGLPNTSASEPEVNKLLWGDAVAFQSTTARVTNPVPDIQIYTIASWPSPSRIRNAGNELGGRIKMLKAEHSKLVVFPGEFDRLGVDVKFNSALKYFLENTNNTVVVLACRFDTLKTGEALAKQFPKRAINVGKTKNILNLLKNAELVIYPAKKLNSKFNPPLVVQESLCLGTPVLVSDIVGVSESMREAGVSVVSGDDQWSAFSKAMVEMMNSQDSSVVCDCAALFNNMISEYVTVYEN